MAKTPAILRRGRVPLPVGRAGFKPHQNLNKSIRFSKITAISADDRSSPYGRFGKPFDRIWDALTTPLRPAAWAWAWVFGCGAGAILVVLFWRYLAQAVAP
jgi:hypothetical protein